MKTVEKTEQRKKEGHSTRWFIYEKKDRLNRYAILDEKSSGKGKRVVADNIRTKEEAVFIAAAPRMLKVLQMLVEDCEQALDGRWDRGDDGFETMHDNITNVINIAKGL